MMAHCRRPYGNSFTRHANIPSTPALIYAVSQGEYGPAVDAFTRFNIPITVMSIGDFFNITCRERFAISKIESFDTLMEEYPETKVFWEEKSFLVA